MKELSVYVWWSAGEGDGDGYDTTIELSDEAYSAVTLSEEEQLEMIDNDEVQEAYEALIENLIEESEENDDYYQSEYCSDDDEEEDEDIDYRSYFESTYSYGVKKPEDLEPFFVAMNLTYPVTFCHEGNKVDEENVEVFTEEDEINKLLECCHAGEKIEDNDELEELVGRIKEKAIEQSGISNEDDLDSMDITIDFPEEISFAEEMM